MSLDRFSTGLPDPQAAPVIGECDECGGEIYQGQEIWRHGHDWYCSTSCLKQVLGTVELTIDD